MGLHTKGHFHFGILLDAFVKHSFTHIEAFVVYERPVLVIFWEPVALFLGMLPT
jgi:hypothetical protein